MANEEDTTLNELVQKVITEELEKSINELKGV